MVSAISRQFLHTPFDGREFLQNAKGYSEKGRLKSLTAKWHNGSYQKNIRGDLQPVEIW